MGRERRDALERSAVRFGSPVPWEPETLLAAQWYPRSWLSTLPEGRLLIAVVEEALRIMQLAPEGIPGRHAVEWLASDADYPFSFVNCCWFLNWDPGQVRRAIREGRGVQLVPRQVQTERRRAPYGMGA